MMVRSLLERLGLWKTKVATAQGSGHSVSDATPSGADPVGQESPHVRGASSSPPSPSGCAVTSGAATSAPNAKQIASSGVEPEPPSVAATYALIKVFCGARTDSSAQPMVLACGQEPKDVFDATVLHASKLGRVPSNYNLYVAALSSSPSRVDGWDARLATKGVPEFVAPKGSILRAATILPQFISRPNLRDLQRWLSPEIERFLREGTYDSPWTDPGYSPTLVGEPPAWTKFFSVKGKKQVVAWHKFTHSYGPR